MAQTPIKQTLVILGDSLSAGHGLQQGQNWTDILQQYLQQNNKNIRLLNASISGDTTANGIKRLSNLPQKIQPHWLLIELGANDGLRGFSIKQIKRNLQILIETGQKMDAQVILMAIKIPPNYGPKYTQAFMQIYPQLAEQYSLPLIPFLLDGIALKAQLMQADGLHPNKDAQAIISHNVWQALAAVIEKPGVIRAKSQADQLKP